jgi:hypothetical protein
MEKTAVPVPGPRLPFTLSFLCHAEVRLAVRGFDETGSVDRLQQKWCQQAG